VSQAVESLLTHYESDPDELRVQLQDVSFCGGVGALGNECRA
jgi:hypothetical protein